jgi:hypothetical protein
VFILPNNKNPPQATKIGKNGVFPCVPSSRMYMGAKVGHLLECIYNFAQFFDNRGFGNFIFLGKSQNWEST